MRHALRLTTTAGGLLALALLAAACSASSSTTQPIGGAETFILTSTSAVADPAYLVTAAGAFAAKGTLAALGAGKSTVKFGDGTFIMARPVAGVHVVVRSLSRRTCAAVPGGNRYLHRRLGHRQVHRHLRIRHRESQVHGNASAPRGRQVRHQQNGPDAGR